MNGNEVKALIEQMRNKTYNNPIYEDLQNFPLYNPDYQNKNPMRYIFLHARAENTLQPVRISKSIAIFLENDIIKKMQEVAKQLNYLVVPASSFHWRRVAQHKKKFPHFLASNFSYIMLPASELNKNERANFIDYLRNLDWHDDIVKNLKKLESKNEGL